MAISRKGKIKLFISNYSGVAVASTVYTENKKKPYSIENKKKKGLSTLDSGRSRMLSKS